jgi:hypothetical protein
LAVGGDAGRVGFGFSQGHILGREGRKGRERWRAEDGTGLEG